MKPSFILEISRGDITSIRADQLEEVRHLMHELLLKADISGKVLVKCICQIRGAPKHRHVLRIGSPNKAIRVVEVTHQISDNGTRYQFNVTTPAGQKIDDFYSALVKAAPFVKDVEVGSKTHRVQPSIVAQIVSPVSTLIPIQPTIPKELLETKSSVVAPLVTGSAPTEPRKSKGFTTKNSDDVSTLMILLSEKAKDRIVDEVTLYNTIAGCMTTTASNAMLGQFVRQLRIMKKIQSHKDGYVILDFRSPVKPIVPIPVATTPPVSMGSLKVVIPTFDSVMATMAQQYLDARKLATENHKRISDLEKQIADAQKQVQDLRHQLSLLGPIIGPGSAHEKMARESGALDNV